MLEDDLLGSGIAADHVIHLRYSYVMRKFVGIDFFEEDAPDATTLLKFRRLLEKNNLNKAFFEAINRVMVESGHISA